MKTISTLLRLTALFFLLLVFSNSFAAFNYLTTHPFSPSNTEPTGSWIDELKAYDGAVYAGYGFDNQGPIELCRIEMGSSNFTCDFSLRTGAVNLYREYSGNLYAPSIDPFETGSSGPFNPGSDAYAIRSANNWVAKAEGQGAGEFDPDMAHLYDMVEFASSLWVIGSDGQVPGATSSDATVWRSADNGATWIKSLEVPPTTFFPSGIPCCARFYFGGILNGKLYVQADNLYANGNTNAGSGVSFPSSYFFDGTSWSSGGPDMLAGNASGSGNESNHTSFNQKLLSKQNFFLYEFNGTSLLQTYVSAIYDYTINDTYVYVLRTDRNIYRSKDLSTWRYVDALPANVNPRSIEVLNRVLFVGLTNGDVYTSDAIIGLDNAFLVPAVIKPLILEDD